MGRRFARVLFGSLASVMRAGFARTAVSSTNGSRDCRCFFALFVFTVKVDAFLACRIYESQMRALKDAENKFRSVLALPPPGVLGDVLPLVTAASGSLRLRCLLVDGVRPPS